MLSVIREGTEYQLDDGSLSFLVGDDGWGMAPLHRLLERGPLQHGETDRGFRLDPRTGTIVLFLRGNSRQDLYDKRSELLDIFGPSDSPLGLRWELSETRQIDCFFAGDMMFGSDDRPGFNQRVAIRLRCPDPTFYDPAGASAVFALGGGSDSLVIPLEVPMVVGASKLDSVTPLQYGGNWLSFPHSIKITGPITDPVINNETINKVLDFTGITIAAGDYYEIDLRWGVKSIVDSLGVNKIADLTDDSNLATWHIAAPPEAPGGTNSIRVTGTAVTENTEVDISYFIRYLGR